MLKQVQGIIHGKTIELHENPGFSDGEEIEVILRPRHVVAGPIPAVPGGRTTAAGMLAHLPLEVDEELEAIIRDRQNAVFREIPR
jgi:hypothetical protein